MPAARAPQAMPPKFLCLSSDDDIEPECQVRMVLGGKGEKLRLGCDAKKQANAEQLVAAVWKKMKVDNKLWSSMCISSRLVLHSQGAGSAEDEQQESAPAAPRPTRLRP